ncbi:MAG: phosphoadenosine phosphosulfate reductase family protein, partial [Kosmotogaceae bacterium]
MIRHIISISGKDSLCTAIVQKQFYPQYSYEYVFSDTGVELPATYEWLNHVETKLGIKIKRIGTNLHSLIEKQGYFIPSINARWCTRKSKIKPLMGYYGNDPCLSYIGFRYDEKHRAKGIFTGNNIKHRFPLIENKIDLNGVWEILNHFQISPPNFVWKRLETEVLNQLSEEEKRFVSGLNLWQYNTLFSGRSRSNCYFCFFQR